MPHTHTSLTAHLLVDNDTDGVGCDVEDAASHAVVELVGHTLLDRSVAGNVDNVAHLTQIEEKKDKKWKRRGKKEGTQEKERQTKERGVSRWRRGG